MGAKGSKGGTNHTHTHTPGQGDVGVGGQQPDPQLVVVLHEHREREACWGARGHGGLPWPRCWWRLWFTRVYHEGRERKGPSICVPSHWERNPAQTGEWSSATCPTRGEKRQKGHDVGVSSGW